MEQLMKFVAYVAPGHENVARALAKTVSRNGRSFSKTLDDGSFIVMSEKKIWMPCCGGDFVKIGEVVWK